MKYCLLTNDVELTSITNNILSLETGKLVLQEGIPKLLALYKKYDISATFYVTGKIVEAYPSIVKMIIDNGHQVGSHSYSHEYDKSHDIMALDDQISALNKSKRLLLDNGAREVTAFRAPALRVNSYTEEALSLCGFLTDSSVSSQRFDAFFSFGTLKKLKWLISPRKPYFTKKHNLFSKGNGQIFEIPISAMLLPYTGTVLRILPTLTSILRRFLILEASLTGKPIVFLIHPNELFLETVKKGINRRGANFLSHFLKDVLRTLLKRKNLGDKALKLYEREIIRLKESGFEFLTINEYYKIFGK